MNRRAENRAAALRMFAYYLSIEREIPGWFDVRFLDVLYAIRQWHLDANVKGHVAEIGVHAGRSFVPLALSRRGGEVAYAIDCFDIEGANRSKSGTWHGERPLLAELRSTLTSFGLDHRVADVASFDCNTSMLVRVLIADTGTLRPPLLIREPIRVFSIDGDHTSAGTLHDLRLADSVMAYGGLIVLDDVFNAQWPTVSRGLYRFCDEAGDWRPVLIGAGRVVLARHDIASLLPYLAARLHIAKSIDWLGQECLVLQGG